MVRRKAILGLAALIAASGCNAGTTGGLKRSEPPAAKETLSKARVIDQINKNAVAIQSVMANPSIVAAGGGQTGHLDGRLAMERPRDFRFKVDFHGRPQADVGTNQQEFWFWIKDESKALYVCDYANADVSPLGVTMQPDWIMEAMGLREIPDREAATIQATPSDKPGQLILTHLRKDPKGGTLTKVMVVNESTGEILEHQLYSGAKEKLLARATISQTQHIEMMATDDNPSGSTVHFPAKIKLEWVAENFSLDITMGKPKINPVFVKADRVVFFSEPQIKGAVKTDLAKLGNSPASARMYESSPRSGIRLGNPELDPSPNEGSSVTPTGNAPADLSSLPRLASGYIGPQVPRAPDSETIQTSTSQGSFRGTFRQ